MVPSDWVAKRRDAWASDDAIEVICESNGVTKEEFISGKGSSELRLLELFLITGFPTVPQLIHFPNLTQLRLMHIGLTKIDHLRSLRQLKALWLNENYISVIENLDELTQLRELYLYSNQITTIGSGLQNLSSLEVLWLQGNHISSVSPDNFMHLTALRSIWLAENQLTTVEGCFHPVTHARIEELNLSNNRLHSFRDILYLAATLPALQRLDFNDPTFGPNPICSLCNYHTFTLYHMRQLRVLDLTAISRDQRSLAESTFHKKRIYYNMRIRTLLRNMRRVVCLAATHAAARMGEVLMSVSMVQRMCADMSAEVDMYHHPLLLSGGRDTTTTTALAATSLQAGSDLISKKLRDMRHVRVALEELNRCLKYLARDNSSKLLLELRTGGNVRLEDGRTKDVWHQSCHELVKTRFFPPPFTPGESTNAIRDIRVSKVTRLHNRALRTRFDAALDRLVDTSDPSYKRALEYLFLVVPPSPYVVALSTANGGGESGGGGSNLPTETLLRVLEFGPTVPDASLAAVSSSSSNHQGIAVTNSVFLLDEVRLARRQATPPSTLRIVVCKVFLGRCCQERSATPATSASSPASASGPCLAWSPPHVLRKDYPPDITAVFRPKPNDAKHRVWFCFDADLVLPEYVVDCDYMLAPSIAATPSTNSGPPSSGGGTSDVFARAASLGSNLSAEEAAEAITDLFPSPSAIDLADLRAAAPDFLRFAQQCSALAGVATLKEQCTRLVSQAPMPPRRSCLGDLVRTLTQKRAKEVDSRRTAATVVPLPPGEVLVDNGGTTVDTGSPMVDVTAPKGAEGAPPQAVDEPCGSSTAPDDRVAIVADALQEVLGLSSVDALAELAVVPIVLPHHALTESLFVDLLAVLPNIQTLRLPFNDIAAFSTTVTPDAVGRPPAVVGHAMLTSLDLSHNMIRSTEGVAGPATFPSLVTLHLHGNLLYRVEESDRIARCFPKLTTLSLQGNPVCDIKGFLDTIIDALASLEALDGMSDVAARRATTRCHTVGRLDAEQVSSIILSSGGGSSSSAFVARGPTPAVGLNCSNSGDTSGAPPALSASLVSGPAQVVDVFAPATSDDNSIVVDIVNAVEPTPLPFLKSGAAKHAAASPYEHNGGKNLRFTFRGHRLSCVPQGLVAALPLISHDTTSQSPPRLTYVNLGDNLLPSLELVVTQFPTAFLNSIETLIADQNRISRMDVSGLLSLRRLDVSGNGITKLDGLANLPQLSYLAAENNFIVHLGPLATCPQLSELYLASNQVVTAKELHTLRDATRLIIVDLSGNPCAAEDLYRLYAAFQLTRLKVLDGVSVDAAEQAKAKDVFAGRVSTELLNERVHPQGAPWSTVVELSLANCAIRELTLLEQFTALVHLALDRNLLSDVSPLRQCCALVSLNLAFNKLHFSPAPLGRVLEPLAALESLSLEGNNIGSLAALQLRFAGLRFLNLRNNELQRVDGLESVPQLRELILDRNRLRAIDGNALCFTPLLQDFSAEENSIKAPLDGLRGLVHLVKVNLATNRIAELSDIERTFDSTPQILDATFTANPVTRRNLYRSAVVHTLRNAVLVDGRDVTQEERDRCDAYYAQESHIPPNVLTDVRPTQTAVVLLTAGGVPTTVMLSGGGGGGTGATGFPGGVRVSGPAASIRVMQLEPAGPPPTATALRPTALLQGGGSAAPPASSMLGARGPQPRTGSADGYGRQRGGVKQAGLPPPIGLPKRR